MTTEIEIEEILIDYDIIIDEIQLDIINIYPELEDLEITPTREEQNFKSNKYGYNNIKVKAIESEELNIIPNTEKQVKEGMFNKITVDGDSNLISENIKKDIEIFGVIGNFKGVDTTDATATSEDIIAGKTAYINGEKIEGTIPNNGELNYIPNESSQKIPSGYTDGGIIEAVDITLLNDYKICLELSKRILGDTEMSLSQYQICLELCEEILGEEQSEV